MPLEIEEVMPEQPASSSNQAVRKIKVQRPASKQSITKRRTTPLQAAIRVGLVAKARRPYALFVLNFSRKNKGRWHGAAMFKAASTAWHKLSNEARHHWHAESQNEFQTQREVLRREGLCPRREKKLLSKKLAMI